VVAEGGEGIVSGEGSDWARVAAGRGLVVLSLARVVFIVERTVGWGGMVVILMGRHRGFSGSIAVLARYRDGEVVRHVG
jgi:hypothetical protein